jgi:glycosyltransferase involved in cell wall biosynthesis
LKVLLSALACEPERGSELEVGFQSMLAAASEHQVWVLTNEGTLAATQRAVMAGPLADRIHLIGIPFGVKQEDFPRLTVPGFHLHYGRWQREAAKVAIALDQQVDFDVLHHATLASYWTRMGISAVRKPLVLGPVGGGVDPPLRLVGELGPRGIIEDASRVLARHVLGRVSSAAAAQRSAVLTFAQNEATARRIRSAGRVIVLSNALAVDVENAPDNTGPRTSEVIFAGRLIPWKAPILALRALRYVQNRSCVLRFCGEGPEESRLKRAAARWGLEERVRFDGWLAREELLTLVARSGVFIHPSVHEEAGLCVAEALSFGTPVVCLDRGGPAELVRGWPKGRGASVPPSGPERTARAMAAHIDRFLGESPAGSVPATTSRLGYFRSWLLEAYAYAYDQR